MITERKNKYRFLLGLFWLISSVSWGQVAVEYPSSTRTVNYDNTSLVNQFEFSMRTAGCRTRPCDTPNKKVYLIVDFSLADDYADITGSGPAITSGVDVILTGDYCRVGTPPFELMKHLDITTDKPRQVYKIDFTSYYNHLANMNVKVDNYTVPLGYEGSVSLSIGFEFDFLFKTDGKIVAASDVVSADPITNSAKNFEWTVDCGHFEMYELQLLKLYNNKEAYALTNDPHIVRADVDWDKALTIHTHSWKQSLRLTLGEGTGYYTWRVRGIGNEFEGAEGNPENWGTWSTHIADGSININPASYIAQPHTFYYNQFDEGRNWMYSRSFIEGEKDLESEVKIGEQIAYANGLLQSKQTQSIQNTNHQVVASETVYDYSGRGSLNSMGAPVYDQSSLGYKKNFFLATDGSAYDASNFDANTNYKEPVAAKLDGAGNGFGYYSEFNTTETYVASAADPTNERIGYPFSRTRFYNDGRAKESSGVGYDHRMHDVPLDVTRTSRIFYGGVADAELIRVFGNEAPDAGSVHKVVTIDPNKTTSISYINKAGQTLFTCLGMPATDNYALIDLESQATAMYSVEEYVDPLITTDYSVMERVKDLILTAPTTLNIDYNIATNIIENSCADFCTTCDYQLEIKVIDKESNVAVYSHNELINPTSVCTSEVNVDIPHIVNLIAGEYRIEQRLRANNVPIGSINTQLEEHVNYLEDYLTENILGSPTTPTGDLFEVMTYLDDNDLVGLYAHLSTSPDATLITEPNGDQHYEVNITIEAGSPCFVVNIPVLECESTDCPETGAEYTALLADYSLTTDILEYEYAQGLVHTYTVPEVNILIGNMLADSADACELWSCWRSQVLGYESALEIEANLNNTPEGADYQYFFMNSFLDCARATQYPEGNHPIIAGTTNPMDDGFDGGYIWSAHTHFYYEDATYLNCQQLLDPTVGPPAFLPYPIDWASYTNEQRQNFYNCISNIQNGGVAAEVEANVYSSIQSGCESQCESKRDAFEEEIINLYRSEGAHIEGDEYYYMLNPAGVPMYIPDDNLPFTGVYTYSLDEISCAVDLLVDYCLGNCEVSNPMTAIQQSNIENVMTSNLLVSKPDEKLGCRDESAWISTTGLADYMISWDFASADATVHSPLPEESLIDMEKDGSGHISVLAGNRVVKYNSSGQVQWSKLFDAELPGVTIQGVQPVSGGYLLSTSNYLLVRLDGSGNIIWTQDYTANIGVSPVQHASKPVITDNGDIYILWYALVDGIFQDVIVHTDDLGNFDWLYTYNGGLLAENNRAIIDLMNDDVIIGSINGKELYAVDNTGNQVWDATADLTDPFNTIRGIDQIDIDNWAIVGNNASGEAIVYEVSSNGVVANLGVPDIFPAHSGQDISASVDGDYLLATTSDIFPNAIQFVVTQMAGGVQDWSENFGSDGEEVNCRLDNYSDGRILLGGTSPEGELSTTNGYKETTTAEGNFWETWYIKFKHHNNACHYTEFCVEWETIEIDTTGFPEPTIFAMLPCEEVQSTYLLGTITSQVASYIIEQKTALIEEYETQCLIPENINDELKLTYEMAGYHYMLYYYDRAGNLVKTVPPQGVDLQDVTLPNVLNRETIPEHILVTDYQYNSLGQMERSHTPDGGETKFYYDKLSRMRFSQNAEQLVRNAYSYMKYDNLGRVIEAGESTLDGVGGAFIDETENQNFPTSLNTDWTRSVYNIPEATISYKGESQQFLRNRISYVYNDENAYTYYSYDPHGNVQWVIQEIPGFDRFSIAYEYDLLSGNVLQVAYNDDDVTNLDKFYHRYAYDADNRLITTETSTDLVIWDTDETNTYNSVGVMNRKITGQDMVQGTDYVSTLHGWIKGINHSSMSKEKDPGQDGLVNTVAQDAFGMVLNYYKDDFRRSSGIGIRYTSTDVDYLAGTHDLYNGNISSWASRIPDQTTGAPDAIEHAGNVTGFTYRYDELQRIKEANFQTRNVGGVEPWIASEDYRAQYSFDANGNLKTLERNGFASSAFGLKMDDFVYEIQHFSGVPITATNYEFQNNQLQSVDDNYTYLPVAGLDYGDITELHKYTYDEIGRLKTDFAEGISSIRWNAFQKVDAIYKTSDEKIFFKYDAHGNRIAKIVVHPTDPTENKTTFYVRDAQGNNMATYTKSTTLSGATYLDQYALTENEIYGADRMGLRTPFNVIVKEVMADGTTTEYSEVVDDFYTRQVGEKMYELKDHLGNVRSVITDRKLYDGADYTANIISIADYYPYGMQMPGRHQSSDLYRYGFNGMEKDDEVKGEGDQYNTQFRQYDSRIGRWLSLDPKMSKYPASAPYNAYHNNPIYWTDPYGDDPPNKFKNYISTDTEFSYINEDGNQINTTIGEYFDIKPTWQDENGNNYGVWNFMPLYQNHNGTVTTIPSDNGVQLTVDAGAANIESMFTNLELVINEIYDWSERTSNTGCKILADKQGIQHGYEPPPRDEKMGDQSKQDTWMLNHEFEGENFASNSFGRTYQNNLFANLEAARESLENGTGFVVGMGLGEKFENTNRSTSHFVYVYGMGQDQDGGFYLKFADNGVTGRAAVLSDSNKIYLRYNEHVGYYLDNADWGYVTEFRIQESSNSE